MLILLIIINNGIFLLILDYANRESKVTTYLNTVLHGLQPYTNYSIQVLALTRQGEGVMSSVITCTTEETGIEPIT